MAMDHVDVKNDVLLNDLVEDWRPTLMTHADYLHSLSISLAAAIKAELERRNMGGSNIFGSDASRAAKSVGAPLAHAGELLTQAAACFTKAWQAYSNNVGEPIKQADGGKPAFEVTGAV